MSCFSGTLREYPAVLVDCFTKDAQAYFLSHCHKDHMDGLNTPALMKRLQSSQHLYIYCSETTKNLLMCDQSYIHLKDYIRDIPVNQPKLVALHTDSTNQNWTEENLLVTLLPAGHCVGSVMFLFEGDNGSVLHTGDFRLAKGDAKRLTYIHSNGRVKDIKSVYVDTTFCLPKMMSIPSREETRDAIIGLIDKWFSRGSGHVVSLLCKGMYGYEFLLKEIAIYYKTKIHVSEERLALYRYLVDMTPYFTTDAKQTRIHACVWKKDKMCQKDLPCTESMKSTHKLQVLRIKPSTLWFSRQREPLPSNCTRYCKDERLWRVVHSMHASMEEIRDFIGYIRPYHVYPTVEPAGIRSLEDAVDSLADLIRTEECDSCNQESSGDVMIQGAASEFDKLQDMEERIKRPVPSAKVIAQCKELGLEDESSFNAPPIKRKRNSKENAAKCSILGSTQQTTDPHTSPGSSFSLRDEPEIGDPEETGASGDAGLDCVRGRTSVPEHAESICDTVITPNFAGKVDEVGATKECAEMCPYSTSEIFERSNFETCDASERSAQSIDCRPNCEVELFWSEDKSTATNCKVMARSGKTHDIAADSAWCTSEAPLREAGRHFTVDAVLNKESSVESRDVKEFDIKNRKKFVLSEGGFASTSAKPVNTAGCTAIQDIHSEQCTGGCKLLLAENNSTEGGIQYEDGEATIKGDSQRPCSQGDDFNVPPSPGHTQPSPGTLRVLHQRLVSRSQLCKQSLLL